MPTPYRQFIFEDYAFDAAAKTLRLHYSLDGQLTFEETYRFRFDFADYDPAVLERSLRTLFFLAGVSYYKTFIPPEIVIHGDGLTAADAEFYGHTYQRGLGEFWYVNQLDPRTEVRFPAGAPEAPPVLSHQGTGMAVGIGGGKDSLLSVEMLRTAQADELATWSMDHQAQLAPLVERIGLPHVPVERTWDRKLLALNREGAYNGHVPISAIFAAAGTVVCVLSGRRDSVVSNEAAANEPTLQYQGVAINHQYSKSQEFERAYQSHLRRHFGDSLRYYSFLRPLSELAIAELFARHGLDEYHDVFSSCNRAYTHDSHELFWCGQCPKCAFVFLMLTPFVQQTALEQLWHGKNLLLDPALRPLYRRLLGIEGDKPLECVGEIKESRAAMRLAQQTYPQLRDIYRFDLPDDYDYRRLQPDEMPADVKQLFNRALDALQR